jgi:hypothetical protein
MRSSVRHFRGGGNPAVVKISMDSGQVLWAFQNDVVLIIRQTVKASIQKEKYKIDKINKIYLYIKL